MRNALVFVHGINNSARERAQLRARLVQHLDRFGALDLFGGGGGGEEPRVGVAKWRSLGDFVGDLVDLRQHPVRWEEAVEDVRGEMVESLHLFKADAVLFVGHSMGQPLLVEALHRLVHEPLTWKPWQRAALLTMGGPMGNGFARPYFERMDAGLWTAPPRESLGVAEWTDLWNPEDPVCGGPTYRAFLAAQAQRLDYPGHPTPFSPMAEHGSYFESAETYARVRAMVERLAVEG